MYEDAELKKNVFGDFLFWTRVARWFIYKQKLPIWVYFGGP
jgi:hypothetical protein